MKSVIVPLAAALALAAAFPQAALPAVARAQDPHPQGNTSLGTDHASVATPLTAPAVLDRPKPQAAERRTVEGVVRLLAADTVKGVPRDDHKLKGHSVDHHRLVLVTDDDSYFLKGKKARPNTKVRVSGQVTGKTLTADKVTEIAALADELPVTGTTRVLVLLAHWNVPDGVTQASARTQLFTDSHRHFQDSSYSRLGQTGDVTPWMKITGPAGGQCFADSVNVMNQAKTAAGALGYDSSRYDNVILYFPDNSWQSGSDCNPYAGWAYVGAPGTWLNGYLDRRVTVHEQGHNYGLSHSHSYLCDNGLTGACVSSDYGDPFDAMGSSDFVGHFSASQKDLLGWLDGRLVDLTAGGSATLAPVASNAVATTTAKIRVSGSRTYWLEYRQAIDYDAALPPSATDGVLVHFTDVALTGNNGSNLIDVRPGDGVSAMSATLKSGASWTSPEGAKFTVGSVTAAGAAVTVVGAPRPVCPDAAFEPDGSGAARTVAVPTTQRRAFCNAGDQDWLKFAASAGRAYRMETLNLAAGAGGSVDTVLSLYAPDGTLVAANDDANGLASRIDFTPRTSGTYVLRAENYDGAGGEALTYDVKVAQRDAVAPVVTARVPGVGATGVAAGSNVSVTLSESVVGVSSSSFTLWNAVSGAAVSAVVSRNGTTNQWILNPNADLVADTRYSVSLGAAGAVKDAAGNPLATHVWTFTTGPAPVVTARVPGVGATGVAAGSNVSVTLSESVVGVSSSSFTLRNAVSGAAVSAVVSRNGTTNQWILNPNSNLVAGTRYSVSLGAAGAVKDAAGNPLVTQVWTFTVAA